MIQERPLNLFIAVYTAFDLSQCKIRREEYALQVLFTEPSRALKAKTDYTKPCVQGDAFNFPSEPLQIDSRSDSGRIYSWLSGFDQSGHPCKFATTVLTASPDKAVYSIGHLPELI